MEEVYPNDDDLLNGLKKGSHAAFEKIYKSHWRLCYRNVYERSGNAELAEEITQAVFISLWENRERTIISNLPAYLATAVKYRFLNYIRAQLIQNQYVLEQGTSARSENGVERYLDHRLLSQALDRALQKLPLKTKEVFTLSRLQSLPVKKIAAKMNLSEKSVEYHITKSLKTIRLALREFIF